MANYRGLSVTAKATLLTITNEVAIDVWTAGNIISFVSMTVEEAESLVKSLNEVILTAKNREMRNGNSGPN